MFFVRVLLPERSINVTGVADHVPHAEKAAAAQVTEPSELPLSRATRAALHGVIDGLDCGVVVVCGFPASGKSTSARYLAKVLRAIVFDKDSFAPALEESVMTELTGNSHDRDSPVYKRVVGPFVYDALVKNALMVGRHHPVVIDAPFIDYVRTASNKGVTLSGYIGSKSDQQVDIRTVWLTTAPETIRERMIKRGAARDLPKLDDWAAYRSEVLDSDIRTNAEQVVDSVIVS